MAGTVTLTEQTVGLLKKVTFAWVSDAAGAADKVTTNIFSGEVVRAVHIPDSGGTQPTDLYDVDVNDADGADLLHGNAANISNAAPTETAPKDGLGALEKSKLTLAVTNAGNAKGGKTILYIR